MVSRFLEKGTIFEIPYLVTFSKNQLMEDMPIAKAIKVANKRELREVQEGATCFCDKKLSNYC